MLLVDSMHRVDMAPLLREWNIDISLVMPIPILVLALMRWLVLKEEA
jgi:hypothetical protein